MIKAIIFDVGGVLIRTQDHSSRRQWEKRLGLAERESEQIVFNSEMDKWGYSEPDYEKDVLLVEIPPENSSQIIEQFSISGLKIGDNVKIPGNRL